MKGSEWDGMKTKGWAKFLRYAYMLVTFPLRRPMIAGILVVCAVTIGYFKKQIDSVWQRYEDTKPVKEVVEAKDSLLDFFKNKVPSSVQSFLPEKIVENVQSEDKKDTVRFVSWSVAKFNRSKYQKKGNGLKIGVPSVGTFSDEKRKAREKRKLQIADDEKELEQQYRDVYYEGDLSDYYIENPSLKLEYLTTVEKLYGEVAVVGPNSLIIDGKFAYLYGIYSDSAVYNVAQARQYLEEVTQNRKIHCDVVAYTYAAQAATALCFVNGVLINRVMVDKNLARNVALR